jgi:alpha-aminoadipic semialdehyde synthase
MTMAREEGSTSKRGNGIVGVLREVHNKWERRAPVTPAHCARLLNAEHGVKRILVQPCTKRIFPDAQYEEVGCEITPDLSDCGLLLGIKRPEVSQQSLSLPSLLEFSSFSFSLQNETPA